MKRVFGSFKGKSVLSKIEENRILPSGIHIRVLSLIVE
jgi:hypothetical protein